MKVLITGVAGFIGFHLAKKFLENKSNKVIGIDNVNDYYDIKIKKKRLKLLKKYEKKLTDDPILQLYIKRCEG